jgi:NAD-dependent SIR2 family protein deacetylase
MHERGKLVRCYTQNIDGIETLEGLTIGGKEGQVCQLHGDIHTLRCDYCNGVHEYTTEWMEMLLDGDAPDCPECVRKCTFPHQSCVDIRFYARINGKTILENRNIITQHRIIQ